MRTPRRIPLESPAIDLTPLIDVVFVVLIVFILVAPLLNLEHIQLAVGNNQVTSFESVQASALKLCVRADNTIWLNDQPLMLEALGLQLRKMRSSYPHAIPQLIQDSRSHFGVHQQVKSALESAGFEQVELILSPRCNSLGYNSLGHRDKGTTA